MTSPNEPVVVIKIGGEVIDQQERLSSICADIAELSESGARIVICHGAGPQTSALQQRLGIEPRIVVGRRITSPDDLQILIAALGQANNALVAGLISCGIPALGFTGASASIVQASHRPPVTLDGQTSPTDFGEVGDIHGIDANRLSAMLAINAMPVIATLAIDETGRVLNVNGDGTAAAIASALNATDLLLLTAVGGIRRDIADETSIIDRLDLAEVEELIAQGVISGGMLPKVQAATSTVNPRTSVTITGSVQRDANGQFLGTTIHQTSF